MAPRLLQGKGSTYNATSADWGPDCDAFIEAAVETDYIRENFADYPEEAAGFCTFALFALGAVLAQYLNGAFDDRDLLAARFILPGFLLNEAQNIVSVLLL
jgi:hypothetical protein